MSILSVIYEKAGRFSLLTNPVSAICSLKLYVLGDLFAYFCVSGDLLAYSLHLRRRCCYVSCLCAIIYLGGQGVSVASRKIWLRRLVCCFLMSGNWFCKKSLCLSNTSFSQSQYSDEKVVRDKPESIGNGLTSSGPVYLYRPYPG